MKNKTSEDNKRSSQFNPTPSFFGLAATPTSTAILLPDLPLLLPLHPRDRDLASMSPYLPSICNPPAIRRAILALGAKA
ncbi:hypothetical protein AAMO2058_000190700 [Amorphochlora amoebiformis]